MPRVSWKRENCVGVVSFWPWISTKIAALTPRWLERGVALKHLSARFWPVPTVEPACENWFAACAPRSRNGEKKNTRFSDYPTAFIRCVPLWVTQIILFCASAFLYLRRAQVCGIASAVTYYLSVSASKHSSLLLQCRRLFNCCYIADI